jgi:5'-nucleotidase
MRHPNDKKLLQKVPEVDMLLGGHDHFYARDNIGGRLLCKSGTDFREFSVIDVTLTKNPEELEGHPDEVVVNRSKGLIMKQTRIEVTSDIEPHEEMKKAIDKHFEKLNEKLEKVCGYTAVDLDSRFEKVRTQETNISNFVADIMRYVYKTDIS